MTTPAKIHFEVFDMRLTEYEEKLFIEHQREVRSLPADARLPPVPVALMSALRREIYAESTATVIEACIAAGVPSSQIPEVVQRALLELDKRNEALSDKDS